MIFGEWLDWNLIKIDDVELLIPLNLLGNNHLSARVLKKYYTKQPDIAVISVIGNKTQNRRLGEEAEFQAMYYHSEIDYIKSTGKQTPPFNIYEPYPNWKYAVVPDGTTSYFIQLQKKGLMPLQAVCIEKTVYENVHDTYILNII